MINAEVYQKHVRELVRLIQELLIESAKASWLISDMLFQSIGSISDPELRKQCESCITINQPSNPKNPRRVTLSEGLEIFYDDRCLFYDLSPEIHAKLYQLDPFRLEIRNGKLNFVEDNAVLIKHAPSIDRVRCR